MYTKVLSQIFQISLFGIFVIHSGFKLVFSVELIDNFVTFHSVWNSLAWHNFLHFPCLRSQQVLANQTKSKTWGERICLSLIPFVRNVPQHTCIHLPWSIFKDLGTTSKTTKVIDASMGQTIVQGLRGSAFRVPLRIFWRDSQGFTRTTHHCQKGLQYLPFQFALKSLSHLVSLYHLPLCPPFVHPNTWLQAFHFEHHARHLSPDQLYFSGLLFCNTGSTSSLFSP